jgi:hypothetical protein
MHRRTARTLFLVAALLAATASARAQTGPTAAPSIGPQIISAEIKPSTIHAGDQVVAMVQTNDDVVAVHAAVHGLKFPIPKQADGMFSKTTKVPWIARFFHGTITVQFTATDAAGASATADADVTIR